MISEKKSINKRLLVEGIGICREFSLGDFTHQALLNVSIEVEENDFLAVAGPSGSGKSTLLNILGCLERPTSGEVKIRGVSTLEMTTSELASFRAEKLGFVFQTFNLIPTLSALENVEYPLLLLGVNSRERKSRAREALVKVGLEKFLLNRPSQLSGGQRQRVAIARAIVKIPLLVLADEPTANLDKKTSAEILDLMQDFNRKEKITFLLSSHDPMVLTRAKSVIHLADGKEIKMKDYTHVA